ncbi:MAG TPA: ATP-grasp domain-containing protein [Spirochaetales bacterium]|nr:ATP-grasp domain-containing protein [Spirochaetales bacterium]HRY55329.1 ATP-grasp domain-containing protein [Spirochaetia bacterium]HRZ64411.1 ATP-grasp domain-containing protein [Spirochaetia bacterium]
MRRIGIIGGGQLGRMAIEEARKYLAHIEVLSPDYPSPGSELADVAHVGPLEDYESVLEFAREVDVVSYEIEHVSLPALRELERLGKPVLPSAGVLAAIKDKSTQKRLLETARIPTARWAMLEGGPGAPPSPAALAAAAEALGGFPLVQKSCLGGYDGLGVAILAGPEGPGALAGPSFAEAKVPIEKELAVVLARSPDGSTAVYPCVEMAFDERANLCDSVVAPARIGAAQRQRAEELALACLRELEAESARSGSPAGAAAGVFAVELFLARSGEILVNEIAPRPHNSGHLTIESCASSQFDQYLRVLLGLPLGSSELLRPAAMVNLLGAPGASGEPEYVGLERALALPGVAVHLYGKREVRPFRKMGHVTALGRDAGEALERAEAARDCVRVMAR